MNLFIWEGDTGGWHILAKAVIGVNHLPHEQLDLRARDNTQQEIFLSQKTAKVRIPA